jgi:16S rRNA A1518/A1519 N6-dimethyltransferase RsmA/KsgA/DIM1 with predicted DNA glycosylase/AP lyase activity
MSTWRRKAIECLPDMKKEIEKKDFSIYEVFSALLDETVKAHRDKDYTQLRKYYDFAEWCFQQKEKALWNAAGVSFYEHLGNQQETAQDMPIWVKKSIYIQIKGLLEFHLGDEKAKKIDQLYR